MADVLLSQLHVCQGFHPGRSLLTSWAKGLGAKSDFRVVVAKVARAHVAVIGGFHLPQVSVPLQTTHASVP